MSLIIASNMKIFREKFNKICLRPVEKKLQSMTVINNIGAKEKEKLS